MSLDVLDWRRKVLDLYRDVRATADPVASHELWRSGREQLVREHPASPNRDSVLRHAPYDASYRFDVVVDTDVERQRIEIATGTDGIVPFERIGRVALDGIGPLDVWWLDSYGGGIWLPIRDASPQTYGGGRYVLDTVKGADLGGEPGRLVVDLNFAYNPSCAYSEHWACPLAPPGNVVVADVSAGELTPD
jgi:hypothetical protein